MVPDGDSRDDIMAATHAALRTHGYADLTIERIAAEFDKGKSLLYYHYDDKEDLLLAFLDHLREEMAADLEEMADRPPADRLGEMVDIALGMCGGDCDRCADAAMEFHAALFEMRAQAPYSDAFADRFDRIASLLTGFIADALAERGADDPEVRAEILSAAFQGMIAEGLSGHEIEDPERLKAMMEELFLDER